ncbi:glycosyltransferase [Acholeplasma manati]|uniref:Glycosyltransferase n=1 Tax=Paracholeplasma manati TaxID=591373 RepID=A0ABT2Y433_9MOLU|nr:glycosyltransferase [Paracholeplasma manati]MCV2231494.1 glycosyltransferase [Paracholeplasma manati]
MKYLFIANSTKPSKEEYFSREKYAINSFSKSSIEAALKLGYEVYMGINRKYASEIVCDYPVKFYNAGIYRSIFNIADIMKAFFRLNRFLKRTKIDVLHCNTPIGGVLGRLCGRLHKVNKIIYTVHGFHFYENASSVSSKIFKFIEKRLAKYTDVLITINSEDYNFSKEDLSFRRCHVYKINGVGIGNFDSSKTISRSDIRLKNSINKDALVIISVGDLVMNKNHETIIKAMSQLDNKNSVLLICGKGNYINKLRKVSAKYNCIDRVMFLGFRNDIKELLVASDIFILASFREGLPRSIMEAMYSKTLCVVSDIRGNRDLITHKILRFSPENSKELAEIINKIDHKDYHTQSIIEHNYRFVQNYSFDVVVDQLISIFNNEIGRVQNESTSFTKQ